MNYFISNNGVQKGPLTFEQLKEQEINRDTLVWTDGTSDWVKASEVEELVPILELLPPPVKNTAKEEMADRAVTEDAESDEYGRKFMDNTKMYSHCLTFKGRARRTEYWIMMAAGNFCVMMPFLLGPFCYDTAFAQTILSVVAIFGLFHQQPQEDAMILDTTVFGS